MALVSRIHDITIIGGGPIGLFVAGIAGEQGASCNVIESRLHPGGVMMAVYPEKDVYNFPGHEVIKGRDLIRKLVVKAKSFGMIARYGEYINDIRIENSRTIAVKSNKGEYQSLAVVLATGLKAQYSPLSDIIEIDDWDGTGIYESWPSTESVRGKKVAILLGSSNRFQFPQDIFSGSEDFIWLWDDPDKAADEVKGEIIGYPWKLSKIGGLKNPDYIIIRNGKSDEERSIEVDAVISLVDMQPRQTLYSNFGIEMVGPQVKVDPRMQTSVKRIYAVGDIAYYPGKIMLLSTGIYEARIAVKNMLKII